MNPAKGAFHETVHGIYLVIYKAAFFNNAVFDPAGSLHGIIHDAFHALVKTSVYMDNYPVKLI